MLVNIFILLQNQLITLAATGAKSTDECAYYKEDAGKMMLGAFENKAKAWGMEGIPDDFCFDQLPEDIDHFEPILSLGLKRMPILNNVGIRTFF